MWEYISAIVIIIGTYLYLNFYLWPRRRFEFYERTLKELGYKVYSYPFIPMGAGSYAASRRDYQIYKDCAKTTKQVTCNYDLRLSNLMNKVSLDLINPELLQEFFKPQNLAIYPKVKFVTSNIRRVLGDGIAFSQGHAWKKKRKVFTAVFNFQFLKSCIPKIIQTCDQQFEYAQKQYFSKFPQADKGTINIFILNIFLGIYSNVMLKCFFGSTTHQAIDGERFSVFLSHILGQIQTQARQRLGILFGHWIYSLGLTHSHRRINRRVKTFRTMAEHLIKGRIHQIHSKGVKENYTDIVEALVSKKLISKKADQSKEDYSFSQLIDEFCTFYAAGTDTTSHMTMVLIYYLALNPHTEKKLREQIDEHIKSEEDYNYQNLKKIKYIDYLQNETLRIYGPGNGIFPREAMQDNFVKDIPIKKGTYIGCSFMSNFYCDKYYKQPLKFRPERWESECKDIPRFAFTPFSAGSKNCIGQHLALLESRIAIIRFIKRYKQIKIPVNSLELRSNFVMTPQEFQTQLILNN